MGQTSLSEFGSIDQTADTGHFVRFLDAACAETSFQQYKQLLIRLLAVKEGHRLLDVGCGTGDDARQIARFVGERGRVVGVDNSQAMVAEARKRAESDSVPVEFHAADALNLPFETASFDGCLADRSLMHVPDPQRALAEMLRVAKSGGRLAVYEVDFETIVIDAEDRTLARKVIHCWCDSVRNGWLGRHIPAILQDLGLKDVSVTPHTLILTPALADLLIGTTTVERAVSQGKLTAAEGQSWLRHLADLQSRQRFLSTLTGFLVAGSK